MITVAPTQGLSIHVPDQFCAEFIEVIRRGMAFEHGQSRAMYDFCDRLEVLIDAQPAATCSEAHQRFNPASVERK
jgi:hypothetical protein